MATSALIFVVIGVLGIVFRKFAAGLYANASSYRFQQRRISEPHAVAVILTIGVLALCLGLGLALGVALSS